MTRIVSDYTKSSQQMVLDLLAHDNTLSLDLFKPENFEWSPPTAVEEGRTEVTVTAKKGSGYTGSKTFNYSRVNLNQVPGITELGPELEGDVTKLSEVVDFINARFGINLQTTDITVNGKDFSVADDPVNQEFDVVHDFSFAAKSDSYAWVGDISFTLTKVRQAFDEIFKVTLLNGLYAPLATPTGFLMKDDEGFVRMTEDGFIRLFENFSEDIVDA